MRKRSIFSGDSLCTIFSCSVAVKKWASSVDNFIASTAIHITQQFLVSESRRVAAVCEWGKSGDWKPQVQIIQTDSLAYVMMCYFPSPPTSSSVTTTMLSLNYTGVMLLRYTAAYMFQETTN